MENQFLDSNLDSVTPQYGEYASFGQRFLAALIDGLILGVARFIIYSIFGINVVNFDPSEVSGSFAVSGIAGLLSLGVQVAYFAYLESSEKQATLGKQAMGIVVTDLNGERITLMNGVGRYFGKILSGIIIGIGFLMQPFTQRKQALHDMIAGTLVYKKY